MGVFFLKINLGVHLWLFVYFKFYILLLTIFFRCIGITNSTQRCAIFLLCAAEENSEARQVFLSWVELQNFSLPKIKT